MSIRQTVLPNGFRIVTEAMPGLMTASVGVWVFAGARHERSTQNGIAHFLEHMAFKGTETLTALQIAEKIEDVGGYINAYTSRETTAYYARVLEKDVALGVNLIADILRNSVFDPAEIENERGVILQEIGQTNDTPDDVVFDWLQEVAYPSQALGRSILGQPENVSGFTQADLVQFVGERYRPDQIVLSAAGAVDHDVIVKQAETLFADWKADSAILPTETASFHAGQRIERKPLEQVHFTLAFEGPHYTHSDIYTAQIFGSLLGGGMSSRLFQELREKLGLCYSVFSQAAAFDDTGLMTIYAGTSAQDTSRLMQAIGDELARTCRDIRIEELDRARAQISAGLLMGLESPSNRAERLARSLQIWGRVPSLEETVAKLDEVSVADVQRFATNLLTAAQPAMAIYGPVGDDIDIGIIQERLVA